MSEELIGKHPEMAIVPAVTNSLSIYGIAHEIVKATPKDHNWMNLGARYKCAECVQYALKSLTRNKVLMAILGVVPKEDTVSLRDYEKLEAELKAVREMRDKMLDYVKSLEFRGSSFLSQIRKSYNDELIRETEAKKAKEAQV